jgi:hypothetical protein
VEAGQKPDSERMESLQKENRQLRKQLIDVQTKLSKLLATMQLLNSSVSETLSSTSDDKEETWEKSPIALAGREQEDSQQDVSQIPPLNSEPFDMSVLGFSSSISQQSIPGKSYVLTSFFFFSFFLVTSVKHQIKLVVSRHLNCSTQLVPILFTFKYQIFGVSNIRWACNRI